MSSGKAAEIMVVPEDIARGVLEAVDDERIVLSVPGTDYRLHFIPAGPITAEVGKRIKGVIHAQALRMFQAAGGGTFIEPAVGEPRIVAGRVLALDQPRRRALVEAVVPMWMTFDLRQKPDAFAVGDLVNCYVESGGRFEPSV